MNSMKENPKVFFSYMKSKSKDKGKINPFINKKGEIVKEKPAEILKQQYRDVWSVYREKDRIPNLEEFFHQGEDRGRPLLTDVFFSEVRVKKALASIRLGAAPGPDGITPFLLKLFSDQLAEPLNLIYQESIENGKFPDIWKLSDVSPVKKPGKQKSKPESFRPVALLCHMGKAMEIVMREEIQDFLEDNGLLSKEQQGWEENRE